MRFVGNGVQKKFEKMAEREKTVYVRSLNIVTIFSLFGAGSLVFFSAYHYYLLDNQLLALVECIFGVIAYANIVFTRWTGNTVVGAHMATILLFSILMILIMTGGIGGTGAYWIATFPVVALFMTGARNGRIWVLGLLVSMLALMLLQQIGYVGLAYSFEEMRQIIASFFIVSAMLSIFAKRIEVDEEKLISLNQELESVNVLLTDAKGTADKKVQEAEEARNKLEASTHELEKTLSVFADREIRMAELKKEMKEVRASKKKIQ